MMESGRPRQLFTLGEATHPGNTGKNNEDSYGYITIPVSDNQSGQLILAIVADGIGGERAGEEASNLAVKTIKDSLLAYGRTADLPNALDQALRAANTAIYRRSQESELFENMGTTAAVAAISDGRLYIANVGDSRIYLVRGKTITQLTTDHSWGQEAVEAGRLSALEVQHHPNRNVLKRYLGISPDVEVDHRAAAPADPPGSQATAPLVMEPDDIVLLCTDGLTDLVSDRAIAGVVVRQAPQSAADRLIEMARRRGGHDNITVLILGFGQVPVRSFALPGGAAIGAAALIILAVLGLSLSGRLGTRAASTLPAYAQASSEPTADLVVADQPAWSDAPASPALPDPADLEHAASPAPSFTAPPTSTPVPTRTPAPTARPTAPPASVAPATVAPTAYATPEQTATPAAIPPALLSPAANETERGRVTFQWQPAGPLPPGAAYELVWCDQQSDPDTTARAFAPATQDTSLSINLDAAFAGSRSIYWTVLIVNTEPYRRLTQPSAGEDRPLIYSACREHQVCKTCTVPVIDPKTGETTTKTVPCECRTVCD